MSFKPTDEQQAIIDVAANNPNQSIMVDARAGAAKTSTIEMMANHSLAHQVGGVLCLAFNVRIKKELEDRVPSSITCLTLNGLGHRAWATRLGRGVRLNVDADKLFDLAKDLISKADKEENEDIMSEVLALTRAAKSAGLVPKGAPMHAPSVLPDTSKSWEDLAWDKGITHSVLAERLARELLLKSIDAAFKGYIDFDDQIYMSVLFGGVFPKYHTVVVDESQDLSTLNHRQLVKCTGTRLISVGDPYQAIYAFRGADNNSMDNMESELGFDFIRLGLTYSFRCPQVVADRQLRHVPDFKAWHTNKEGAVIRWPVTPEVEPSWSIDSIPHEGAIICRNNAPLMKLAFALIKNRRPVKILGRDIGAALAKTLLKACGKQKQMPVAEGFAAIKLWRDTEIAKVADSKSKSDIINDRYDSLYVLLEASGSKTIGEAADFITQLFADRGESLVLCSGHRSKGLEWDWVMHLDPWRVPSKWAKKALDDGNPGPMRQELNLKYVIETRTKDALVLASLDDCAELGEG